MSKYQFDVLIEYPEGNGRHALEQVISAVHGSGFSCRTSAIRLTFVYDGEYPGELVEHVVRAVQRHRGQVMACEVESK